MNLSEWNIPVFHTYIAESFIHKPILPNDQLLSLDGEARP